MSKLPVEWCAGPELIALPGDLMESEGTDLLMRWTRHQDFWDARLAAGLDPFFRTSTERVAPACTVLTRGHERIFGVNFASCDYLSLTSHPAVSEAAIEAIRRWGVHSGGSVLSQGGSLPLMALEERFAELLSCRDATIFSSAWGTLQGVVRALVRESDHVVVDAATHRAMREAAAGATRNVHRIANSSHVAVRQCLSRIRETDSRSGILVMTESLFSLAGTVPDLRALRDVCRDFQAALLVDVSHDLGAIGDHGLGILGEQGMVGEVDLVVGSFSPTFASHGGFVASNAPGVRQALRIFAEPLSRSNALSPMQASIVGAALTVIRSREGAERRRRLMHNALRLRKALSARAFRVLGRSSGIVPVGFEGIAQARLMTRAALAAGGLVQLIEHPAVARQTGRWCLQVMTDHKDEHIDRLVSIAVAARETLPVGAWRPELAVETDKSDAGLEVPGS